MVFSNTARSMFIPVSLVILLISSLSVIDARLMETQDSPMKQIKSSEYKRLASYCYIDDYTSWLQRQQELLMWFDLAKILKLPIHEDKQFQRELQQYRLQHECLRVMERLPVSVGPG